VTNYFNQKKDEYFYSLWLKDRY